MHPRSLVPPYSIAILGIALAGCGSRHTTPEATAEAFVKAMQQGNLTAYKAALVPGARPNVTSASPPLLPAAVRDSGYSVGQASIDGENAKVMVHFTPGPEGSLSALHLHMRQTGSEWLIYGLGLDKGDGAEFVLDLEHPERSFGQLFGSALRGMRPKIVLPKDRQLGNYPKRQGAAGGPPD
jgi:hypothetical protein